MFDDFGEGQAADGKGIGKVSDVSKKPRLEPPGSRTYLRAYETLPAQLLNAYGMARYEQLTDEEVWGELVKPLKTGAVYMTEYASVLAERRGVAINRMLLAVLNYLAYQRSDAIKKKNEYVLNQKICKDLYAEIDQIYPALEYCLAPKKQADKSGASVLRQSADTRDDSSKKDPSTLDKYANQIYEWMGQKTSRIRMLMSFQGAGGLPYGSSVHHRATQCFIAYGNKLHDGKGNEVSLKEFQEAIQVRHRIGSAGVSAGGEGLRDDFC